MKKSIKEWSVDDRPREKLISKGKESLSKRELIAILIGSGTRKESALDLAQRILDSVNHNLHNLARLSVSDLCQFHGIGHAKAISIITALEIGRRRLLEKANQKTKITHSQDLFELMSPLLSDLIEEQFWIIYLDHRLQVLHQKMVSSGGFTQTIVDTRKIFKYALECNATQIVLVHNHPTGNTTPSLSDKELTQKVKKAGEFIDITVVDHIIIAQNNYLSFADEDLL
ncbi:MAG: RadC family protein [Flavobacteriales bacterium]